MVKTILSRQKDNMCLLDLLINTQHVTPIQNNARFHLNFWVYFD